MAELTFTSENGPNARLGQLGKRNCISQMQMRGHNYTKAQLEKDPTGNAAGAKVLPSPSPWINTDSPQLEGTARSPTHLCRSWNYYSLARRCSWSASRIGAIVRRRGPRSRQAARHTGRRREPGCQEQRGTLSQVSCPWPLPLTGHLEVAAARWGWEEGIEPFAKNTSQLGINNYLPAVQGWIPRGQQNIIQQ